MQSPYGSRLVRAIAILALAWTASCRGVQTMPAGERTLLEQEYNGHYFSLRQSVFFGPFFDDPNLMLVDARPFDALPYLLGPTGSPLSPGASRGIFPAGTRVRIERLDLPTLGTMVGRPLLTPRYNTWVRLRVNRFDVADVPGFEDRTYVMLLPIGLTAAAQADGVLSTLLGPDDDVKAWMDRRSPAARSAIVGKTAAPGLTYEELVAALGLPDRIDREEGAQGKKEIARFGSARVTLLNDVVTTVD